MHAGGLLASRAGAYTTARTVGGTSVFELSFHIARLASSARLMLEADMREGRPGAEALWQQYSGALGDPTALRPRVEASLRAGVAFYHQALASRGLASSMIASSNGSGSSSSRGSGNGSSAAAAPEPELRLTVLLTWGPGGAEVWSHVSTLPPRPAPPVRVEVRGAPRSNAAAKDSKWVLQRRELEQSMGPGVNEVRCCCRAQVQHGLDFAGAQCGPSRHLAAGSGSWKRLGCGLEGWARVHYYCSSWSGTRCLLAW